MQMLAFGQYNNIILNNTPNYLKIGTHVQNYKNNRKILKIFCLLFFFLKNHVFKFIAISHSKIHFKFIFLGSDQAHD